MRSACSQAFSKRVADIFELHTLKSVRFGAPALHLAQFERRLWQQRMSSAASHGRPTLGYTLEVCDELDYQASYQGQVKAEQPPHPLQVRRLAKIGRHGIVEQQRNHPKRRAAKPKFPIGPKTGVFPPPYRRQPVRAASTLAELIRVKCSLSVALADDKRLLHCAPLRHKRPLRAPPRECVEHTNQEAQTGRPGQLLLH